MAEGLGDIMEDYLKRQTVGAKGQVHNRKYIWTRRDFIILADLIGSTNTRDELVEAIAEKCYELNPAFSSSKFFAQVERAEKERSGKGIKK